MFSRPDLGSFDWATAPRSLRAHPRQSGAFTQIKTRSWDQLENPTYVSYCIVGWVPNETLAAETTCYFYRFECAEETADRWSVRADNRVFKLFWADLDSLPQIAPPQPAWLDYLLESASAGAESD